MPTLDLFQPQSEKAIRDALGAAKAQAHDRLASEYDLAVDYLEGRQLEDVRGQLDLRYRKTQSGPAGQVIEPVTIPLVERYIAEAASAYNRPVKRELVNEAGVVDEDTTQALVDELEACGYDERLHRLDQIALLLGSCGLWFQARRGKLRPVITLPQSVRPIAPPVGGYHDPADQDDYLGFVVDIDYASQDTSAVAPMTYAMITPAEVIFYESSEPYEIQNEISRHPNPYTWGQVVDTEDQRGSSSDLPLQMMTVWHKRLPIGELIPDTDPDVVYLNRELNVQASVLLDTMRVQGFSTLIFKTNDAQTPPSAVSYGSRFAINMGIEEDAIFSSAANPYTELVRVLEQLAKMFAISKRMSPNDFSIDGRGPESGFAKLVASLPKLEAREERTRRLKYTEEQIAWPRICSVLQYLGKLPAGAERLSLRVEYADIEFPRTADEETKKQEHEFKHGLSSPATVLSKRMGVTEDEARDIIEKNRAGGATPGSAVAGSEEPGAAPRRPGLIGQLIGRPQGVDIGRR